MKYIIIVNDTESVYKDRSPYHRNVVQTTPQGTDEWHINRVGWVKYKGWYGVETEAEALLLADKLAQAFPTQEVLVSKVETIFQSEKPKVTKKSITIQGVLPV